MRALSIRQPWVEQILRGEKRIEYRSWPPPEGLARIIIHASQRRVPGTAGLPRGFVGMVSVVGVDEYDDGTFGWRLDNPFRLPEPVPGHGKLNLFTPPAEVVRQVEARCPWFA